MNSGHKSSPFVDSYNPTFGKASAMGAFLLLAITLLIATPLATEAKTGHPKGYERAKGSSITISEPLGWPISVSANSKLDGSIESLPGMAVIRVKAYKSWYNMFTTIPSTTTLSIKGLPANKELHIYTNGYREHVVMTTNNTGMLKINRPTGRGMQVIIKERSSTYNIQVGGLINPAGGDCSMIGTWTTSTKTCKLNRDVTDGVVVEDDNITIDGAKPTTGNFSITGIGSGDGIFTDQSNIVVKNLIIRNFSRGVAYADTFFSIAPSGGQMNNLTLDQNLSQAVVDDIPGVHITNTNTIGGTTGVRLSDTTDFFFGTDDLQFTDSSISGAGIGIFFSGIEGVLLRGNTFDTNTTALSGTIDGSVTAYQNNFKNNTTDIAGLSGTLILQGSATERGNYWSKNTATNCNKSGNACTNPYDAGPATDNLPWACENGWKAGVTCPSVPPVGGGNSYVIRDDATGGDCPQFVVSGVGGWSASTQTCTLGKNITGTVTIENTTPISPITLDGNNFTIDSGSVSPVGTGILIESANVQVKNISLFRFSSGALVRNTSNATLENVRGRENTVAVSLSSVTSVVLQNLTLEQNVAALSIADNSYATLTASSIRINTNGIVARDSAFGATDNTVTGNTIGIDAQNSTGTLTENSFIDNTDQATISGNGLLFSDTDSGNFWSDHACSVSPTDSSRCTNSYQVEGNIFAPDVVDQHPWACADGWNIPCSGSGDAPIMIQPVDMPDALVECYYPSYYETDPKIPGPHKGIDVVSSLGSGRLADKHVRAVAGGTIIKVDSANLSDAGNYIWIDHGPVKRLDLGVEQNISTAYLHMDTVNFSLADGANRTPIVTGEILGTVGDTDGGGTVVSAPHLHFEIRRGVITSTTVRKSLPALNPHDFLFYPSEKPETMCYGVGSPVYIKITAPDGRVLTYGRNDFGDTVAAYYLFEEPKGDEIDGEGYQMAYINNRTEGEYIIEIIPKPGVSNTETYTLVLNVGDRRLVLADHVQIGSRPQFPYVIRSTPSELAILSNGSTRYNPNKITVCHVPPGNPNNAHTISISSSAWKAHEKHGDYRGKCRDSDDRDDDKDEEEDEDEDEDEEENEDKNDDRNEDKDDHNENDDDQDDEDDRERRDKQDKKGDDRSGNAKGKKR